MINRKLAKLLSKRYVILASMLFIAALGLVLLPSYQKNEKITAENLLAKVINPERYISSDALADKIITQDPSIMLIDVREPEEFNKYTLPKAINIPLGEVLNADYQDILNQDKYSVILFSNENFKANQAWILLNRLGYKNLHLLNGGINGWYNTILNPPKPSETMTNEAFELYNFRQAAGLYFGVGLEVEEKVVAKKVIKKAVKKIVPVKKKKKRMPEGGC